MRIPRLRAWEEGQSIVEVAFALPMLFLLAIGIVELGHALTAYNITINAAREGARFGSMGGSDTGVQTIVQGATSQLIGYDETNSDLYVVRAELTGAAPNCTVITDTFSCDPVIDTPNLSTNCLSTGELVSRLDTSGAGNCDFDVIAVDLYYRSPSLLGLPLVKQLSEAVPMRSLTVMRLETPRPLASICNVYPIAIHTSVLAGKKGQDINDILNGTGEGNFGWLRWPNDPSGGSAEVLVDSLLRPTSSEFENPLDPTDTHLTVGDWIWANSGLSNSAEARQALDRLINKGWIRVVVFDQHSNENGGANGMYHAYNFAIVQLRAYHLPGKNSISITFIDYDSTGCVD
jgi:hypothetical protein